ncbi:MAG: class I SAM-dependent methyltransferase [Sphingomonadaceae bacterium]
MTLLRKLIAGGETRRSRLHDELGRRIATGPLLRNGPRALLSGAMRLLFGYRVPKPWISYDAQALLARFLNKHSRVLEFGSGMSTAWYARHAGSVCSIEDNRDWHDMVSEQLARHANVELRFAPDRSAYTGLAPDQEFDLIMIDGSYRDDCARFAIAHLAAGGTIYLDNCDMNPGTLTGDVPEARRILLDFAKAENLPVREFTDLAPTQLHVQRGLWVGGGREGSAAKV